MPTATYEELLVESAPAVIEDDAHYESVCTRLCDLVGKRRKRSAEETKLMRLLGLLVQDYDRRNAMPPDDSTPAEMLQFLLEHSGKTPADLTPVFGQKSHAHEALTGKRPIGIPQARKLGKMFCVAPGLFIR